MKSKLLFVSVLICLLFASELDLEAQKRRRGRSSASAMDTSLLSTMQYRHIGPFRGGRAAAVAGTPLNDRLYYMGATGGGVWKTADGGASWENISDGFFGGSVGAVEVAPSDPNVIYVGGGEVTVRGNVSHGYGMWKSVDAGKTWSFTGLGDTRHIPRIQIHPNNPDIVWVAALGHLYGPNDERGVFKSTDGGKTWRKVLFVSNEAGAVDIEIDPNNHRILYASTWKVKRTPYSLESGGEGSGLWKSTDGGETWKDISANKGLPDGIWGISGVTISPANSDRIWAIIENEKGGVYRSDDGGDSWRRINQERKLRQRAWYYTRIYADSQNEDVVYVMNVRFWKSKDGGKSYESIRTPHGDHHDLWINPKNPENMAVADDGGAQITYNGGESWSTYMNQPTAQFYRVTTDDHFPYRIYVAQQDNTTLRIDSRSFGRGIDEDNWEPTAGGESGWIAPDPKNPDIVYGGSYGGYLERYDHSTGYSRAVNIWPDNPMGWAAKDLKFRFQWNFPILFSRHDPNVLYAAANVLFKTTNEGESWTMLSEDLTRNDTTKMGSSGGPITKDNTSVEYYGTIFTMAEAVKNPDIIWTGSDDGLIYISTDKGQNWTNVTPSEKLLPAFSQINDMDAHPSKDGGLYIAATRYKLDDFKPYLLKTEDFGKSWELINSGIDQEHFTRAIQADPDREGLLYAGTESGMYVSFTDGELWQPFQQNLPVVPITDLALKNNDLIVATQGRSVWVLDDLTRLHQLNDNVAAQNFTLFQPRQTFRVRGGRGGGQSGENPPNGVVFTYFMNTELDTSTRVQLDIREPDGDLIVSYLTKPQKENRAHRKLEPKKGMNEVNWDLRYPAASSFDDIILWGGGLQGPMAVSGSYTAVLKVNGDSTSLKFDVEADPRSDASQTEIQQQFDLLMEIRNKLTETHDAIRQMRSVQNDLAGWMKKLDTDEHKELRTQAKAISKELKSIEKALYQTQNQSPQDPLNFPIRLNNKLSALVGVVASGAYKPTKQSFEVKDELVAAINGELERYQRVVNDQIPAFNQAILNAKIPAITLD